MLAGSLPKLVATTVVHGAKPGESHGGAYIIDLETQSVFQVIDQLAEDIDWFGEEGGRGLRGIAFDADAIYIAAGNQLLAYSRDFELTGSWQNPSLVNCHGISVFQRKLYLASTGNDCILAFDLDEKKFDWAMQVKSEHFCYKAVTFDPLAPDGPLVINKLHLNSVRCQTDGMHFCGLNTDGILHFNGKDINMSVELPTGARDAQLFRNGVLFNDSHAGVLRYSGDDEGQEDRAMPVPFFTESDHSPHDPDAVRMLKRGYARGLSVVSETVVAGGSTPAGVAIYDLRGNRRLTSVRITRDTRMAVNSIAVIPPLP